MWIGVLGVLVVCVLRAPTLLWFGVLVVLVVLVVFVVLVVLVGLVGLVGLAWWWCVAGGVAHCGLVCVVLVCWCSCMCVLPGGLMPPWWFGVLVVW